MLREPCPWCGGTREATDTAPGLVAFFCRDCQARTIEEVVE